MMKILTTNTQTIIGELVSSTPDVVLLKNPALLVLKQEQGTGRTRIYVEPLFPREILANPDEVRNVEFNRSSIVSEFNTELAPGIVQNYNDINLPLEELKKKFSNPIPQNTGSNFPVDKSKIIQL